MILQIINEETYALIGAPSRQPLAPLASSHLIGADPHFGVQSWLWCSMEPPSKREAILRSYAAGGTRQPKMANFGMSGGTPRFQTIAEAAQAQSACVGWWVDVSLTTLVQSLVPVCIIVMLGFWERRYLFGSTNSGCGAPFRHWRSGLRLRKLRIRKQRDHRQGSIVEVQVIICQLDSNLADFEKCTKTEILRV